MTASGSQVCGAKTGEGSPCHRTVQNGGRCFMHGDDALPDDHGAPAGNNNAVGNSGGDGAPRGNTRARKHGVYQPVERRLEGLTPEEEALFDYYFEEYEREAAPDAATGRITRAASAAVLLDRLFEELFEEGAVETGTPRLERITALTTLMRERRLILKETGYYDISH